MRAFAIALLWATAAFAQNDAAALHKLFADYFEDTLRWSPEFATALGRTEYNDRWTDNSRSARDARHAARQRYLERLKGFEPAALSEQDRISRDLLEYELTQTLATEPLDPMLNVGQMFGFHNRIFSTVEQMPARTVRDYENIIARIRRVPAYVDQNIAWTEEGMAGGFVQPKNVADLVIAQLATQGRMSEDATPLLAAFRKFPATVPDAERARLLREARVAYATEFLPSWHKLHGWFRNSYVPKTRPQAGIGSGIPDGANWYAKLVREMTTTSLSPKEIHEIGKRELTRIESEMTAIARQAGFAGTLAEFQEKTRADPKNRFRDKEDMLEYCRNLAMLAEPELPRLFKVLPRMPFGIKPIPPDREAVTASHYLRPALDGTRAGFFMLNAYEPATQVKYDKPSLLLHEGVPGHHLQIALQQELQALPDFRKVYVVTAYTEGWALYAESLGTEMGIYGDPLTRFGQLASERFRAVRLVVDTGIHAFGWTRDEAVRFFSEHAPEEPVAEIDRYISWPGQALGYKIGQMKIRDLRARSEQRLGAGFDIRSFHDAVLRNGPLPLELLERQVNAELR